MAANRWKQDKFYISTFNATWDDEYIPVHLQYHKETGFNLIEFTFKNPEHIDKALPVCEELGLYTLVQNREFGGVGFDDPADLSPEAVERGVARYGGYPHLLGYYVWDEPGEEKMPLCGELLARFREADPRHLAFSVTGPSYGLYPWNAKGSDWNEDADPEDSVYARYVKRYVEQCDCDVLSLDYYPFAVNQQANLLVNDMWRDVGLVSRWARETGRPFWFYFQGKWNFPADDNTGGIGMTYGKLGAQAFGAVAYGARQVSYFTSSSLVSTLTDAKGPLYDEVKLLNHRLMNIGTFLLDKDCVAVTHSGLEEKWFRPYFLFRMEDFPEVVSLPDGLILSRFEGEGAPCLMVVNKDFDRPVEGSLTLSRPRRVAWFNEDTGLCEDLGVVETIPLRLEPGAGRVYVLKEEA